jgi:hypothetical protein
MILFSVNDAVQRGANVIGAWVPALIAAIVILIVGYFVAKLIGRLVTGGLRKASFDRRVHTGPGGTYLSRITPEPSQLSGRVVFWLVFLGAISLALTALGIDALTAFIANVYAYLPRVLAALLIFLIATAVAGAVAALVSRLMGDTALGKIVATAAPILVFTIATFMILDELLIAPTIVTITYAGLIGALALGSALAFGLGGRDVAGRMLEGAYVKGQANKEQFKRELQTGIDRASAEKERLTAGSHPEPWEVGSRRST